MFAKALTILLLPAPFVCPHAIADDEAFSLSATGTVMKATGGEPQYLTVICGTERYSVKNPCPKRNRVRSGDLIAVHNGQIRVLGTGTLPETQPADASAIADGRLHRSYVSISGVLRAVIRDELDEDYNWLVLSTPHGMVYAATTEYDHPLGSLANLRDRAVEIRGRVARFMHWRNFLRYHVLVYGTGGIRALDSEPKEFAHLHRQHFAGRVAGRGAGHLFVTADDGEFLPITFIGDVPPVGVGHRVSVVGYAEPGPCGRQLVEATLQDASCGQTPPPSRPLEIKAKDLPEKYGQVVRLRGTVTGFRPDGRQRDAIILSCDGLPVAVDASVLGNRPGSDIEIGCTLDASGICFAQFTAKTGSTPFPTFGGFTLIPRGTDDVRVLSRPSWWTLGKSLGVIAVLLAVLCVLSIRNRLRMQTERTRAEAKTEERTHLAVELHDSISQTLTGIALQIDAAIKSGNGMPDATLALLQTARRMLTSCRHELKCCLWDLRTRIFEDKDMTDAVRRTVSPHVGETVLAVRFNILRRKLSDNTAHTILRIIRELAINAVRHGGARHLKIAGELHEGLVRCSVQDDGRGFDPSAAPGPAQGHFGLQGIRERLRERQGKLSAESAPGKGARFVITLPADEEPS